MRRILLDEGVPIGVHTLIPGFDIEAVPELGWAGLSNGDLIQAAEEAGFEVLITCDQNIRHQQNLAARRLAVVVLATKHWDTIRANGGGILPAVEKAAVGSFVTVEVPRPPRRRRRQPLPGEPA